MLLEDVAELQLPLGFPIGRLAGAAGNCSSAIAKVSKTPLSDPHIVRGILVMMGNHIKDGERDLLE